MSTHTPERAHEPPTPAHPNHTPIRTLAEGALDIVGDIHGEFEALCDLLGHLGYDHRGQHAQGRRLVFLGDLIDRGPRSPSVVQTVRGMVEAGRAQCILGNHELNALRLQRKDGNAWFYGERDDDGRPAFDEIIAHEADRREMLAFFDGLPLALERPELRVVHACWDDASVDAVRGGGRAIEQFRVHERALRRELERETNPDAWESQLIFQNRNPIKVLTSGFERRHAGFMHNGKLRHNQRVTWWNDYSEHAPFCVFGHYNRLNVPDNEAYIFDAHDDPHAALGAGNCTCIDFGGGWRPRERRMGRAGKFRSRLAALRWPEGDIVDDSGERHRMQRRSPSHCQRRILQHRASSEQVP